ncbi:phosphate starvation-inducible protein PhoH, partial [Salmonella enterica subsp. enterica serovar Cerro]|nr:phosphate starvation-inducible protein PhoH [Salmonella enterica subsp. enterica serovar Cerro]
MVMSAPGHIVYSSYNTLYGHSLSGGGLVTLKALIISLT